MRAPGKSPVRSSDWARQKWASAKRSSVARALQLGYSLRVLVLGGQFAAGTEMRVALLAGGAAEAGAVYCRQRRAVLDVACHRREHDRHTAASGNVANRFEVRAETGVNRFQARIIGSHVAADKGLHPPPLRRHLAPGVAGLKHVSQ